MLKPQQQPGTSVKNITISNGTRQGCVSGLWFYTLGTLKANLAFKSMITQTADDVHIIKDSLTIFPKVIEEFRKIGQIQ